MMATPIDKNSHFSVTVTEDNMKVFLSILNIDEENINFDDVLKMLKDNSITFGIKTDIVKETIHKVNSEKVVLENILIAEGRAAINGEDGRVDFLFNLHEKIKPREEERGGVDFHDLGIVENVNEGQPLARLIDPTLGKAGKNVFNMEIKQIEGKPSKLPPLSENTKLSDNDKDLMISCIKGNVKYVGGTIYVTTYYTVEKDVDFSVGNIVYAGPIIVKGDVKSGFNISGGGDIEIFGTVADASIKSDKNITVKYGFIGSGKGKIEAKGDAHIRFVRNQTIKAENVIIDNEVIDSMIYAKNNVLAKGQRISIEGGLTTAGEKIEANVLGNKYELPTVLHVGIDYTAKSGMLKISSDINHITTEINTIDKELKILERERNKNLQINNKISNLLIHKDMLNKKVSDLSTREKILTKNLKINKDAEIVVKNTVFPGVRIEIADANLTAVDKYDKTTFYLSNEEIKTK